MGRNKAGNWRQTEEVSQWGLSTSSRTSRISSIRADVHTGYKVAHTHAHTRRTKAAMTTERKANSGRGQALCGKLQPPLPAFLCPSVCLCCADKSGFDSQNPRARPPFPSPRRTLGVCVSARCVIDNIDIFARVQWQGTGQQRLISTLGS